MSTWGWIDEIRRAVNQNKLERLAEIANALDQAESSKSILCAKGYGLPAMSVVDVARLVPDAK
jgi:hypothetical protein